MQGLLPLVIMVALMWALLIRPQQRRVRLHRAIVESLQAGDEVITSGGLWGMILAVEDEVLVLEVAPGTSVRVLRSAVQQRVAPEQESEDPVSELASDIDQADPDRLGGPSTGGSSNGGPSTGDSSGAQD